MTSKQAGSPQMPNGTGYGFGMMVSDEPQGKRFGHGGGAPGMNGELRVYVRSGTIVVVLANLDPPAATRLADFFDERMPVDGLSTYDAHASVDESSQSDCSSTDVVDEQRRASRPVLPFRSCGACS